MKRPCADQFCEVIGRPFVRVTGSPALTSLAGPIHTLSTPSTGASQEIQRPSGESLTPKNVGLSNNVRRGMSERTVPIKWDSLWQVAADQTNRWRHDAKSKFALAHGPRLRVGSFAGPD